MGEGIKTRRGETNGVITNTVYLYNLGDESTTLTGGWALVDGSGTFTKASDHLYLYAGSDTVGPNRAVVSTTNAILVTNFAKIKFDIEVALTGPTPRDAWITVSSVKTGQVTDNRLASTNITSSLSRQILELDVSSISGSNYIKVSAYGGSASRTCTLKAYRIWGE